MVCRKLKVADTGVPIPDDQLPPLLRRVSRIRTQPRSVLAPYRALTRSWAARVPPTAVTPVDAITAGLAGERTCSLSMLRQAARGCQAQLSATALGSLRVSANGSSDLALGALGWAAAANDH